MQNYQGDIGIIKSEIKTENLKPLPKEGFIVALGEVTGHKHRVVADKDSIVEIAEAENGRFYLRVKTGTATIVHEEHKPITFTEGDYNIIRQVEYDELGDRRVQD